MIINGVVHCLFEQSGTFKNEFKKLGLFCDVVMQGLPVKEIEEAREELLNVNKS